ncbi:hypothetical protein QR680_014685 [Steinernema hermaphroditum]|uniref:Uncharacterized protein n=1 Tax=Steinernema hermaphroditum TaxID=289476 RepID=A0AA39I9U9_9BILA|nr:hypothetical protein QR680_014685 [Steinernema hermaphroditum]
MFFKRWQKKPLPDCVNDVRLCPPGSGDRQCQRCRYKRFRSHRQCDESSGSLTETSLFPKTTFENGDYPIITVAANLMNDYRRRKAETYPYNSKARGTSENGDSLYTYEDHFNLVHFEKRELILLVTNLPELRTLPEHSVNDLIEYLNPYYMSFTHGASAADFIRYTVDKSLAHNRLFLAPNVYLDMAPLRKIKDPNCYALLQTKRFVRDSGLIKNVNIDFFAKTLLFHFAMAKEYFTEKILQIFQDETEVAIFKHFMIYGLVARFLEDTGHVEFKRVRRALANMELEIVKFFSFRYSIRNEINDKVKAKIASKEYNQLRYEGMLSLESNENTWPPVPRSLRKVDI